MPLSPKSRQGRPCAASIAISCDWAVATKIRRRHAASAGAFSSSQVATPRLAKSP